MAINTPKCLDVQLPGGGKINNCAQGLPNTSPYNNPPTPEVPVEEADLGTPASIPQESIDNATLVAVNTLESLGIDIPEELKIMRV